MRTLCPLCVLVFLVGGCHRPPGLAVVNRGDRDLHDATIAFEPRGNTQRKIRTDLLVPGGYMSMTGTDTKFGVPAVASWRNEDGRRGEVPLDTHLPPFFTDYAVFEFTNGGARMVTVKRSEIDNYLRDVRAAR